MFKRIKTIKNVGRFINCQNIQLGMVTLIYGPNCYGKSTMSDIFRSLDTRNPEPILKRKSMGQNTSEPEVSLTFITDQIISENEITFVNEFWQLENFNYQIEIFDSRFINDNVFTDLTITRHNKENLTNLILGEQGVDLGRQIKGLKQKYFEKSKEIGDSEDLLKRQLGMLDLGLNLEGFIQIEKPIDISIIKSRIISLGETKRRLEKSIAEKNKIMFLEAPQKLSIPDCFLSLKEINNLLQKDFQNLNEDAYKKLKEHIKKHIAAVGGNEEWWIKSGISTYLKNGEGKIEDANCPFCSQSLKPVKELIQTYQNLFSGEYENFCERIENQLDAAYEQLEESERDFENTKVLIANNSANLQRYQEYINESDVGIIESIEEKRRILNAAIFSLQPSISKVKKEIYAKQQEKIKKPFFKIETTFNLEEIKHQQDSLSLAFEEYNNSLKIIIDSLAGLKSKSEKKELNLELNKIFQLLRENEIKLKRYELSSDIDKLLLLKQEREKLESQKGKAQEELEKNNRDFVEQYFQKTTAIFNNLGSVGFKIEPSYVRRGGQPVFEPIIKFNNEEVTDDKISYVFSDADRRALAFSVFLAKLKKKSDNDLKNTIVILDDPATSYDDNRISKTLDEVKNLSTSCRQIIVLAHHSKFLLNTYERLKNATNIDLKFLGIKRKNGGSVFDICDDPETSLDSHAKQIEKVQRFIDGDTDVDTTGIRRSLRPILQKELEWRYRTTLKGSNYNGLGSLTDRLKEKGMIEAGLASEIYNFNDNLKDGHHNTEQSTAEDTRSLARSILEFVFHKLNPVNGSED